MSERGWPSSIDGIEERKQEPREANGKGTPPPEWQPDPTLACSASGLATADRRSPGHSRPGDQDAWRRWSAGLRVFFSGCIF